MRLALLGFDTKALGLLQSLAAAADSTIDSVCGLDDNSVSQVIPLFPAARRLSSWEELVSGQVPDGVLVCGADDSVLEGTRLLAAEKLPIFLIPDARQGSAFIYGLSLVHDDSQVPLIPVPALTSHPLLQQMKSLVESGRLGDVQLIRLERQVEAASGSGLSGSEVDQLLLDDAAVLRMLGGSYTRVTAVNTGGGPDAVSQATVTLAGEELVEATWTARTGKESWTLSVTGSSGEAVLTIDADTRRGRLKLTSDGQPAEKDNEVQCSGIEARDAQRRIIKSGRDTDHTAVEATHASLRRRRTVDLYFETTSERSIFKSQMTAVGCGLILLTLFSLIAFLLLCAFLDSRSLTQRSAEADGRVLTEQDFSGVQLNERGRRHIQELTRRLRRRNARHSGRRRGDQSAAAAARG